MSRLQHQLITVWAGLYFFVVLALIITTWLDQDHSNAKVLWHTFLYVFTGAVPFAAVCRYHFNKSREADER